MGQLKGKKGVWAKAGAGGSYRGYKYERAAPKDYQTTAHQKDIGSKGRQMGEKCKGKKGAEFTTCRHEVLG